MAALSDIARVTGAKPRSVQLWADAGVLVADVGTDHEGPGTHREFSRDEVVIACIIAPFAADKVAIGGLLNLAHGIRHAQSKFPVHFEEAIGGKGEVILAISKRRFDPETKLRHSERPEYMLTLISGPEARQPLDGFVSENAVDFPLIQILSLNKVLTPLRGIKG
jgi:hypothetical protein